MAPVLDGLKVIDVSQVAAVPMAARILADFGAEVIHVENPEIGDIFRHVLEGMTTGIQSEINYIWENYNRNKKGMTLDLTKKEGREILHKMLESADILITNLRPYELKKFDCEYQTLKALNPRLIGAYLTGFGKNGPEKDNPAYDHTAYWSRSGIPYRLQSLTVALQNPEAAPPAFIPSFGDHAAGMILVSGIMMALYDREKTGMGQEVGTSLFQAGVYQMAFDLSASLVSGQDCVRVDPAKDGQNPLVGLYRTKDDRWILFTALVAERYMPLACKAIGREDLMEDPRFIGLDNIKENHLAIKEILAAAFLTKTLAEWKPILTEIGLPYGPVQSHDEVIVDQQARANNFFEAYEHPDHGTIEGVAAPIHLSRHEKTAITPAPEFSQHTEELLIEYGYTWEDIARFQDLGVIA